MPRRKKITKEEIEEINQIFDEVLMDPLITRNIHKTLEEAKQTINTKTNNVVELSNTIYILDDICKDQNMPIHSRSIVWEIISKIEKIKEKIS
jgi:uncharacterized protein (UPF0147 family)